MFFLVFYGKSREILWLFGGKRREAQNKFVKNEGSEEKKIDIFPDFC